MNIEIREPQTDAEWNDYFDLRYRILRAPLNQALGSEKNDGDASGLHFALYENKILKAIARLDLAEVQVAQVRFVAVEESEHGKGFGKAIMFAAEQTAKDRKDSKMILQARENAVDFYLKLDYRLVKKTHLLFDQVQHFLMEKTL